MPNVYRPGTEAHDAYEAGQCHESTCVAAFHRAAGQPVRDVPTVPSDDEVRLRIRLIGEEFCEFLIACGMDQEMVSRIDSYIWNYSEPKGGLGELTGECDLIATADALTDLSYVITGTCVQMGLPKEALFDEVQVSNMSKFEGGVKLDANGKVVKGPRYRKPDVAKVLREHGWEGK